MPINSFNTQFIGRQFLHLPVCDSTNAVVMQKLGESELENGAIIMADFQTAGRGQRSAKWDASPGLNLTFTIALFPDLPVQHQFYLNIITSLAISDSLKLHLGELLSERLKIKWPNDLYYDDHKLCGILIQNNLKVNMIQSSAIGIGINVNQLYFENIKATSLKSITNTPWNRFELLKDVAMNLEERYFQLKSRELEKLKQDYSAQLYWHNEWHIFQDDAGNFKGKIIGIREDGLLLVNRDPGVKAYNLKEIVYFK
ncbi:biotin--[acetyl-CoA-carboxylase] ligase [Catalinimonas niigatensis]|uniref:biotin--[acetyl-CoA-carboxylase] ligase n=1 Tax=Catalinimonas niigatensis TaxID=1397264 RepID=UPI002AA2A63E|nr:biotin--[acetyl-CoA-carboxylase] ligase [Catalinimonas niigatensis]WPP52549.1 biotin--[acetyl-CoA-carboxylase] ligase [Catalinimonas niigatensis]